MSFLLYFNTNDAAMEGGATMGMGFARRDFCLPSSCFTLLASRFCPPSSVLRPPSSDTPSLYFRIGFYPGESFCFADPARFGFIGILDREVYLPAFRACGIYIFPKRAFLYLVNGHMAYITALGIHSLGSHFRPVFPFLILPHVRFQPSQ